MEPRISVITLGTKDLNRATEFYTDMGFRRHEGITDGVSFYQLNGVILSLFPEEDLAKDAEIELGKPGFSGVSLAYNTRSEAEVDEVLALAKKHGGTIVKEAKKAFWGGYSGYFADTDGHLWEVAYNPSFPIDSEGNISLPRG